VSVATSLGLEGLVCVQPQVFADDRGFFFESYHQERYQKMGIACDFVQDNHSRSVYGTLRGLHYQSTPGQAKLVRVLSGRIFDVAVDIRPQSPTFGQWAGVYLDAEKHAQLFVPVGFAHGFCVVSDVAEVAYKVSALYNPSTECSIAWNDPAIGVEWPVKDPLLSARDMQASSWAQFCAKVLP
jgi:dTDP-4-dehydrorhamnose 3,5-epimerase